MNYKINTLIGDIKIEKTSSLIATVGDIRAEKEADAHWVNIFINDNSDIGYSFIDQIELSEKDDIETKEELVVFIMNWYFTNVQVVTEKQNEINIQKAKEYREDLEYKKAVEDLAKYTEEQLFEELEKRGLCKTEILEDKASNDYLILEEIKASLDRHLKTKIKNIGNRERENEIVLDKINRLLSIYENLKQNEHEKIN